jgi:hypothetical protein
MPVVSLPVKNAEYGHAREGGMNSHFYMDIPLLIRPLPHARRSGKRA